MGENKVKEEEYVETTGQEYSKVVWTHRNDWDRGRSRLKRRGIKGIKELVERRGLKFRENERRVKDRTKWKLTVYCEMEEGGDKFEEEWRDMNALAIEAGSSFEEDSWIYFNHDDQGISFGSQNNERD